MQISAGALLGRDGRSDRRWAKYFLKKRLVHFVASNACSAYDQPFCLDQMHQQFIRMNRLDEWERMQKNTHLLLEGGRVTPPALHIIRIDEGTEGGDGFAPISNIQNKTASRNEILSDRGRNVPA